MIIVFCILKWSEGATNHWIGWKFTGTPPYFIVKTLVSCRFYLAPRKKKRNLYRDHTNFYSSSWPVTWGCSWDVNPITHDGSGSVCHIKGSVHWPSTNIPLSFVGINLPLTYGSVIGMEYLATYKPQWLQAWPECINKTPKLGCKPYKNVRTVTFFPTEVELYRKPGGGQWYGLFTLQVMKPLPRGQPSLDGVGHGCFHRNNEANP